MKRIIALLLVLSSLCMLFACSGTDAHSELKPFAKALSEGGASSAAIETHVDTALGMLGATYTVSYSDGAANVEYTKDALHEITPDTESSDGLITKLEGSATVSSDGTVTDGELGALVASVVARNIKLDCEYITYTVNESTLNASVKADDTEYVLGAYIGYDATLSITVTDGDVESILITYVAEAGACQLFCEFN